LLEEITHETNLDDTVILKAGDEDSISEEDDDSEEDDTDQENEDNTEEEE
jgi:hypothetical protein